jgi:hypothetical protein
VGNSVARKVVAAFMGHVKVDTTINICTQVMPALLRRGIRHDIISPREMVLPSDTRDTKVARDVPLKVPGIYRRGGI